MAGWARAAGLEVSFDAATNLHGWRPGTAGLGDLATGSHLDTVVEAGPLDGAYGAVAAVEVAAALCGTPLRHGLRVLALSNEEGARGTPGMVGSSALAGVPLTVAEPDDEGVPLGERLTSAGGDPAALAGCALRDVAAFLELHVEQGPLLEHLGVPVGVVDAITGRANLELTVHGLAQHAGTTPMPLRRDALAAAARLVLEVEQLAVDGHLRVATVGRLESLPGVRNVVAGTALLSLDLRDVDAARLERAVGLVEEAAARVAARTGTTVALRRGASVAPVVTDARLRGCIADAAAHLGLATTTLPSGAGHDAQVLAAVVPVGMVFVPSRRGLSHHPEEATDPQQLVDGADVLLQALLLADQRLGARDADRDAVPSARPEGARP